MSFVPLQVHSSYSLLQSPIRVKELVQRAKELGYTSLALTDRNVLYGAVDFYNAATEAGIKPLIGLEMTVALNNVDGTTIDLVFIAKNREGYQNLMDLSTLHQTTDHQQLPLTIHDVLSHLSALVVIVPPQTSVYSWLKDDMQPLMALKDNIDTGSLYLGVNPQLDTVQRATLEQLGKRAQVELVGMNAVDYLKPTDLFASKVLRAIDQNVTLDDPAQSAKQEGRHYLRQQEQVMTDYESAGLQAAAEATAQIADDCQLDFEFKSPVLPHFKTPNGLTSEQYLRQLCIAGLKKRQVAPGLTIKDYQQRLAKELHVIHQMGFDDYFLIVWDVMNFAHSTDITTDPGRGSAAGSLVAYALAITEVDPLQYRLLFERFLNPERAQMPDIDLDIPYNRRDEVLQYVHNKYGHQRVAQIITFGTLAAKQVIRDVGRVFGLTRYQVNELTASLPHGLHLTIASALRESQPLRNLLADHPTYRLLIQVAQQLEGLPRHYSTHAAGVVLSERPLSQIVPLQEGSDGLLMTQFPKDTVEALGLLKMDFLGLKNLSILDQAVQLIHASSPEFDLTKIALNDPTTLALFQKGDTDGVFQFESAGIRQVLTSLHPDSFEDIVAVNALYRPGPLENIPHFIARKHGQETINIPDPSLEPILGSTYGILVYQEQVMQVASVMAGFSLGEADLLRRAMSKKKRQTMESMRHNFIAGAEQRGYARRLAQQVFDYIDQFANYGFNLSHAVAYSKLAFEMAYLKCHYPAEFFTALMNAETNMAKLKQHVSDAKRFNVIVSGPRINVSDRSFTFNNGKIYFGLAAIKGMRRDFIAAIIDERQLHGEYKDLRNFVDRLPSKWQKAELIAPLIYVGAFDGLGYNRAEMIGSLDQLISGIKLFAGTDGLGSDPQLQSSIKQRPEYPLITRLTKENEYLGVYLSGHPVSQFAELATHLHASKVASLPLDRPVTVLILVNRVKVIHTKKDHRQMAFVTGSDETGSVNITIFPRQYDRFNKLLEPNTILVVRGKTEERSGHGLQIVADQVDNAQEVQQRSIPVNRRWVLRVNDVQQREQLVKQLHELTRNQRGRTPVLLYYPQTDQKYLEAARYWLNTSEEVANTLNRLFGADNVVLQELTQQKEN